MISCFEDGVLYERAINEMERVLIAEVLKKTCGNQTQASKLLGLSRPTLEEKIEKLGIKKEITIQGD